MKTNQLHCTVLTPTECFAGDWTKQWKTRSRYVYPRAFIRGDPFFGIPQHRSPAIRFSVRSSCDVCPTINTPRLESYFAPIPPRGKATQRLHFSQEVSMIDSLCSVLFCSPSGSGVCFSSNFEKSQHTHTDEHEHKTNQMNPTVERQTYNKIFHPFPDPAAFLTFWGNSYSNSQASKLRKQALKSKWQENTLRPVQ